MATVGRYLATLIAAALAATLAAIIPSVIAGVNEGSGAAEILANWSVVAIFFVALGHAVLLGLPAGLLLQLAELANLLTASAAGFVIGAIPVGLLMIFSSSPDYASMGGVVTAIGGSRTAAGWWFVLKSAGTTGLYGAAGGLAAWAVWRGSVRAPWLWFGGALFMAAALFVAPTRAVDTSCHNPIRDGRSSIVRLGADLSIGPSEWPALATLFERHAETLGWSFRNLSRNGPALILDLSACSEQGTIIWVMAQIWPGEPTLVGGLPVSIVLYQPESTVEAWEEAIRPLLQVVQQRWAGQLVFTGRAGEAIEPPDWMRATSP